MPKTVPQPLLNARFPWSTSRGRFCTFSAHTPQEDPSVYELFLMAGVPTSVVVECPRCTGPIVCALEVNVLPPRPGRLGREVVVRVTDLADRFSEHYRAARHVGREVEPWHGKAHTHE